MQARLLDDLLEDFENLTLGTEYPVCGTRCIFCNESEDLLLIPRFKGVEGSLSEARPSARCAMFVRCRGCGKETEGKV